MISKRKASGKGPSSQPCHAMFSNGLAGFLGFGGRGGAHAHPRTALKPKELPEVDGWDQQITAKGMDEI